MTNYEFGLIVKRKREELGYTQDMLAKMIGYKHKTSIAKIENGERDIPRKKIIELAEALHTTPDYLMGWNGYHSSESIASRIVVLAQDRNVSLGELAQKIGLSEKEFLFFLNNEAENTTSEKTKRILLSIAKILEVNIEYFYGYAIGTMDSQENYISFLAHKVDNGIPMTPEESEIYAAYINDELPENIFAAGLSKDEKLLIDLFRSVPDDKKKLAIEMIRAALKAQ